jgi:hypothetical protein
VDKNMKVQRQPDSEGADPGKARRFLQVSQLVLASQQQR